MRVCTSSKQEAPPLEGGVIHAPIVLTPDNIAKNTGYSNGYIRRECNRLAKEGALEKDAEGSSPFYTIIETGEKYLRENPNIGENDER